MKILLLCAATAGLLLGGSVAVAETYDVSIVDFAFEPADLVIEAGDTVRWTNNGAVVHTATSGTDCTPDGEFDSGDIAPGGEFELVFDTDGTYDYLCVYHCTTMTGQIIVEEATPAETNSWGEIRTMYR